METKAEFHARMQRLAGINPRPVTRRAGNWLRFNCGDHVYSHVDPRHIGTVQAICNSYDVLVRWENGWKSWEPAHDLRRTA